MTTASAAARIDLHTHIVPERWEDFAGCYGGGRWPRLVPRDACHATIMTGDAVFRAVTDQSWRPERRIAAPRAISGRQPGVPRLA